MHTPPERFSLVDTEELSRLERMALNMPETETRWIEQGNHIYADSLAERKIGGPVFDFPYRRWIIAMCPANVVPMFAEMRRLREENCELRAELMLARERAA